MQDPLSNAIYDEMALGRDLTAYAVRRHEDGSATYRLSLSLDLPADVVARLQESAKKNNCGITRRLRHIARRGLKLCFMEEDGEAE